MEILLKILAYCITLVSSVIFFSKLGTANAYNDCKKKKALWTNALAFAAGFLVGMLYFL